jgi:hypothetical protein
MSRLNGWAAEPIATAITAFTGVGATEIFTAEIDCQIKDIVFMATGNNTSATVAKIFISSNKQSDDARYNVFIDHMTLPIANPSNTSAVSEAKQTLAINRPLQAGQRLLCALGTAPGGGWDVVVFVDPAYDRVLSPPS